MTCSVSIVEPGHSGYKRTWINQTYIHPRSLGTPAPRKRSRRVSCWSLDQARPLALRMGNRIANRRHLLLGRRTRGLALRPCVAPRGPVIRFAWPLFGIRLAPESLRVVCQQVVVIEAEAGDRRRGPDTGVWPVPVVQVGYRTPIKPTSERCGTHGIRGTGCGYTFPARCDVLALAFFVAREMS